MNRGRPRKFGPKNPGKRFLAKNKRAMQPERKGELAKDVKQIIMRGLEKKYCDVELQYTSQNRTAQLYQISKNTNRNLSAQIIRGVSNGQRLGDSINPTLLEFNYNVYYSQSSVAVNPQHTLRVLIFRWNEDLAINTPQAGEILEYTSSGIGDYVDVTSPLLNAAKKQRLFTMLYDRTHNVGASAPGPSKRLRIKLKGGLDFNRNSDAIGGNGHIWCMIVADDVTGGVDPQLYIQLTSRMWYTDA